MRDLSCKDIEVTVRLRRSVSRKVNVREIKDKQTFQSDEPKFRIESWWFDTRDSEGKGVYI